MTLWLSVCETRRTARECEPQSSSTEAVPAAVSAKGLFSRVFGWLGWVIERLLMIVNTRYLLLPCLEGVSVMYHTCQGP